MNIPNLPTDNLYKFCAIAGLIMIGLSLYAPYQMIWQLSEEAIALKRETKKINTEIRIFEQEERLNSFLTELDETISQDEQRNKAIIVPKDKKAEESLSIKKEIKNLSNEIKELKRLRLKLNELESNFEGFSKSGIRLEIIIYVGWFFGILGIYLTIYGFRNWYIKIQVFQDEIIKKQAQEAGIEIKKTKAK